MKRIIPDKIYEGEPCSVVAVGCALGVTGTLVECLFSRELHSDGYLSLDGMNRLIRSNLKVERRLNFRRGERPTLREYAATYSGKRAIVCVAGHFLYFDGRNYYSFFKNGGDPVISAWILK